MRNSKLYQFLVDGEKEGKGQDIYFMLEVFFILFSIFALARLELSPILDELSSIGVIVWCAWLLYRTALTKNGALIWLAFWFIYKAVKIYFGGL